MEQPRVIQVNVSKGGVPKTAVERAWVRRFGVDGDGHNDRTLHGGPHRAVCLYGIEAIERLQSEGHQVEPGSVGENLTTAGVEWSTLPVGTRARIGSNLVIELADATSPCATLKRAFRDGRFSRISINIHPSDSRMYARVLSEGQVAPGDAIEVLPPDPDGRAHDELLLDRLDWALAKANLAAWRAAEAAGHDVRIVDDGEIAMAAAPELPGPAFNQGLGFARLPNLLRMATDFYDRQATSAWITSDEPPTDGAEPATILDIWAADPWAISPPAWPEGVTARVATADDAAAVEEVIHRSGSAGAEGEAAREAWRAVMQGLAGQPHRAIVLVERAAGPLAMGTVSSYHATGWLRGGAVVPEARGQGLHRALLAERARLATTMGCTLVGGSAVPGSLSARNLEQVGFRRVGTRKQYRYDPQRGGASRP
jgi:MOSC domain-containing protein YiiM/GNAT superfamily N-acetyltransferase